MSLNANTIQVQTVLGQSQGEGLAQALWEGRIVESEEVRPGVILDFDANERVIGVEFLGIYSRATPEELSNFQFQTA